MEQECVFCRIVSHAEPATYRYEDNEVIVFDNVLNWERVMLLIVPRRHQSQTELWSNLGSVGRIAMEMGKSHIEGGFRILSNFGSYGMQSQSHGHLHVLSGIDSIFTPYGVLNQSIVDKVCSPKYEILRTEKSILYDESHIVREAPITALAVPTGDSRSQHELWSDLGGFGCDLTGIGWDMSTNGFRLLSNFPFNFHDAGGEKGHVHLLGGAPLGPYA